MLQWHFRRAESGRLIRQGKRRKGEGLVKKHEVEPIHVDVSLVNSSNELDINKVRSWQKDFEKVKGTSHEYWAH